MFFPILLKGVEMIDVLVWSLSVCCLVPPVWRAAVSAAWVLAGISFAWCVLQSQG